MFSPAGTKPQCLHHRADPWRVCLAREKEVQALPGVSQGAAEVQSLRAHPYPHQEVSVHPCGHSFGRCDLLTLYLIYLTSLVLFALL